MTPNRLDALPDYGLHTLIVCLLEDHRRTGDAWYLTEARKVDEYMRAKNDA